MPVRETSVLTCLEAKLVACNSGNEVILRVITFQPQRPLQWEWMSPRPDDYNCSNMILQA